MKEVHARKEGAGRKPALSRDVSGVGERANAPGNRRGGQPTGIVRGFDRLILQEYFAEENGAAREI
ncbi:hypothetical protein LRX75_05525 [Rhizobium sp. DKSPLA3]|uniref:Uncharacterized protein n=1 Tax=Rhizobium quercicola TaxID=2901226 RepID=A0A9X1NNU6_9HYPH|nr:hypothetical protein [Rhizobium quercicola]MCD7108502.1 hypothetical protein [Rhizobium quercicola]